MKRWKLPLPVWSGTRAQVRGLIVALILLAAAWGLLALTDEVREGGFARLDRALLLALRRHGDLAPMGPRWLQESARDVTALGGFTVLTLIAVVAVLTLLALGRRAQAAVFGATVIVAQLVSSGFKSVVGRPRPDIAPYADLFYSSSFPSGHATMAPVVYLTLAAMLAATTPRPSIKLLAFAVASLVVVMVGVSRVYLGVHWPTDVLAGWTLGAALALAASLLLRLAAVQPGRKAPGV